MLKKFYIAALSMICCVATLDTTLGKARPQQNYQSSYRVPKMANPYRGGSYGANVNFPSIQQALVNPTQLDQMRPVPTAQFQAEYDYDPILTRISAMGEMAIANARSEAAALRKRALIESGDVGIASEMKADEATIEAARQNPFSTRKLLEKEIAERGKGLDISMNDRNLFFSGERARRLEEQATGAAQEQANFGQALRDILANITTGLTIAEENEVRRQALAAMAAQPRGGYYPPGGGQQPPPGGNDTSGYYTRGNLDDMPAGYDWEAPVGVPSFWDVWAPPPEEDPLVYGLGGIKYV